MRGLDKFSIGIVSGTVLLVVVIIVVALLQPEPKADQIEEPNVSAGERIPTTEIIVAVQPIAKGSDFVQGYVGRRPWPASNIPPDVIADEAELFGKVANKEIVQGQPIVRGMLSDKPTPINVPQLYAWCDVDSTTLIYTFSGAAGTKEPNIVLGSSGVVRLENIEWENQAEISCVRDGFGQVTVNFVDPNPAIEDMILYSCTLPLECRDGAVTVTTYPPPETK